MVTSRGTRNVRLHATNSNGTRNVEIRVKAKRKGNWHSTVEDGSPADDPLIDTRSFWIFVDFGGEPKYWIVPDVWMRNDIHVAHLDYLSRHGGHRAKNDRSNHHSIAEARLDKWQDRWDILNVF